MARFTTYAVKCAENDQTETGGTHLLMELAIAGVDLGDVAVDVLMEIAINGIEPEVKAYALCALAHAATPCMLETDEFVEMLVTQKDKDLVPYCMQVLGKLSLMEANKSKMLANVQIVQTLLNNKNFDILCSICVDPIQMVALPGVVQAAKDNLGNNICALELLAMLAKDPVTANELAQDKDVCQLLIQKTSDYRFCTHAIDVMTNIASSPENIQRLYEIPKIMHTMWDALYMKSHAVFFMTNMTRNKDAAFDAIEAVHLLKDLALDTREMREIRIAAAEAVLNIVSWPRARAVIHKYTLFDEMLDDPDLHRLAVLGHAIHKLDGEPISVTTEDCEIMEEALRYAIDGHMALHIPLQAMASARKKFECEESIKKALQMAKDNNDSVSKLYAASLLV